MFKEIDLLLHNEIILDFKDIKFISRSATDELLKTIKQNNLKVQFDNMHENIKSMVEIVEKQDKSKEDTFSVSEILDPKDFIELFANS